jgi:hypothetical protein
MRDDQFRVNLGIGFLTGSRKRSDQGRRCLRQVLYSGKLLSLIVNDTE